jgi:hypothetical protein
MSSIKNISLFVPHVYGNFTSAMIMEVFNGLHIGEVKSVDLVAKMGSDSKHYNAAYIHFTSWYDTKVAYDFQKQLLDPKQDVKVMYDHPWYWIVLENKGKKHLPGDRKQTIDLNSFNTPEKPVIAVNISKNKIKKPKSWIKLTKPVNLEAAFDAEYVNNGFTQEELNLLDELVEFYEKRANNGFTQIELDWLDDQVEFDKLYAIVPELPLSEDIKALKYEVATLNAQLFSAVNERNTFEELYMKEMEKNKSVMEMIKADNNKYKNIKKTDCIYESMYEFV